MTTKQGAPRHIKALHTFIDSWFPLQIAGHLHQMIPELPDNTVEDLSALIKGSGIAFECMSSQRIAVTCLRTFGEMLCGQMLLLTVRAEIELTHRCTFHCKYCTARNRSVNRKSTLTNQKVASLIRLYADAGCKYLHFTGGEISLVDYVPALVRLAASLGIRTSISSNGSGSTEFYRRLVKAGLGDAHISFDTCLPQLFDQLTGTLGSWNRADATLKFLCTEGKQFNAQLSVVANLVLTAETLLSLAMTTRYLLSMGIDDIKLMPVFGDDSALDKLSAIFRSSIEPEVLGILQAYQGLPMFRFRLARLFSGRIHGMEDDEKYSLSDCALQMDQAMVRADGIYAPCYIYMCHQYAMPDYRMGNIRNGLALRSKFAREALRDTYVRDWTCKGHCPEIIRDANGTIRTVVSAGVTEILRSLNSDRGIVVGKMDVDYNTFTSPVTCCTADMPNVWLAIPYMYGDHLGEILRIPAYDGLQVEAATDCFCILGWHSDKPIVDRLLRLYFDRSGERHFVYQVISPNRPEVSRVSAAITEALLPKLLLVSLCLTGCRRTEAKIAVPPVLSDSHYFSGCQEGGDSGL